MERAAGYEIFQARDSDLHRIADLLDGVSSFLLEKGIPQWRSPTDRAVLLDEIRAGEVHAVRRGDRILATFSIRRRKYYWPPDETDFRDGAVYLYRFALGKKWFGKGLGSEVLERIEEFLFDQGVEEIRLDCWAGNEILRAFYSEEWIYLPR
ncbi:GCN5-related N-acetyltransferase [Spirochaeta thermophila DSM 6578]|uniref:GCN5-related N-acetyltransferase n=1 Tax=Winmispira thermophila (strain ATCC 700085 / DSM 6578 / Z-1203) TaxID=869211 RepID=G0GBA5_WINT7|nr:GNAT family N-acetyltransferase [Spirochaeta thermophila]AEJ61914.1 GCN5-related N-acetyltransferase [Spirochaeta thermophila DSM 6578]